MSEDEQGGGGVIAPRIAELPEIKLFGRWNCDDVQVNDMSLHVNIFGIVPHNYLLCLILSFLYSYISISYVTHHDENAYFFF